MTGGATTGVTGGLTGGVPGAVAAQAPESSGSFVAKRWATSAESR